MEENGKDFSWKGTAYYITLKGKWNDDKYGLPWKVYAGKRYIGSCVSLANQWKPDSCEDFYNIYTGWGANLEVSDIRQRGRTVEELIEVAKKWQNTVGDYDTPLAQYYDAIVLHAIVETYVGKEFENDAINTLLEHNFNVEHGSDDEDSEMNIDFKVSKDGVLKYLIQVKPITFIYGNRQHTWEDRINAFDKHRKGNARYPGVPYYYLIYDGTNLKWVFNPSKNRCIFEYEELVLPNGRPVIRYGDLVKNEVDKLFNNN